MARTVFVKKTSEREGERERNWLWHGKLTGTRVMFLLMSLKIENAAFRTRTTAGDAQHRGRVLD